MVAVIAAPRHRAQHTCSGAGSHSRRDPSLTSPPREPQRLGRRRAEQPCTVARARARMASPQRIRPAAMAPFRTSARHRPRPSPPPPAPSAACSHWRCCGRWAPTQAGRGAGSSVPTTLASLCDLRSVVRGLRRHRRVDTAPATTRVAVSTTTPAVATTRPPSSSQANVATTVPIAPRPIATYSVVKEAASTRVRSRWPSTAAR